MNKSEKQKKGGIRNNSVNGDSDSTPKKRFVITTSIAIITIIFLILAAGIGSYLGVYYQNEAKKETTAKLIYDDIDRMNWTLNELSSEITNNPHTIIIIHTPVYSDNDIYYSIRPDVALLDDNIVRTYQFFMRICSMLKYIDKRLIT